MTEKDSDDQDVDEEEDENSFVEIARKREKVSHLRWLPKYHDFGYSEFTLAGSSFGGSFSGQRLVMTRMRKKMKMRNHSFRRAIR